MHNNNTSQNNKPKYIPPAKRRLMNQSPPIVQTSPIELQITTRIPTSQPVVQTHILRKPKLPQTTRSGMRSTSRSVLHPISPLPSPSPSPPPLATYDLQRMICERTKLIDELSKVHSTNKSRLQYETSKYEEDLLKLQELKNNLASAHNNLIENLNLLQHTSIDLRNSKNDVKRATMDRTSLYTENDQRSLYMITWIDNWLQHTNYSILCMQSTYDKLLMQENELKFIFNEIKVNIDKQEKHCQELKKKLQLLASHYEKLERKQQDQIEWTDGIIALWERLDNGIYVN